MKQDDQVDLGNRLLHQLTMHVPAMSSTHVIEAALASTLYNQVDGTANGHGIVNTRGILLQTDVEGHSYEIVEAIDSLAPLFARPCHGVPWTDHNLLILAGGALVLEKKGRGNT